MYNQSFTKSERALKRFETIEINGTDQNLDDDISSSDESFNDVDTKASSKNKKFNYIKNRMYPNIKDDLEEPAMPNINVNRTKLKFANNEAEDKSTFFIKKLKL